MNHQFIPLKTIRAWYPYKNARRRDNEAFYALALEIANRGDRGSDEGVFVPRERGDYAPAEAMALFLGDTSQIATRRGHVLPHYPKMKSEVIFWSGTCLDIVSLAVSVVRIQDLNNLLASFGLMGPHQSVHAFRAKLVATMAPVIDEMAKVVGGKLRRYDEVGFGQIPMEGARLAHMRLRVARAMASACDRPRLFLRLVGEPTDAFVTRVASPARPVSHHSTPPVGESRTSPAPTDGKGSFDPVAAVLLRQCGTDTRCVQGRVYINVEVPSCVENTPKFVDVKIGTSVYGGRSRTNDAHAARWMTLCDVEFPIPQAVATSMRALCDAALLESRSDTGNVLEYFLHAVCRSMNYRRFTSNPPPHKEHFIMSRSQLKWMCSELRHAALRGGGSFDDRCEDVSARCPFFWNEAP